MNKFNHESITVDFHGRKVTLERRTPVDRPAQFTYWHDPNTGDVYNIDPETGEVALIYNTTKK